MRQPKPEKKPTVIDEEGYSLRPNKSKIRREALALNALAERLSQLKTAEFARLNLPDHIREGIILVRDIRAHGARKRQFQFLGKLFRAWQEEAPEAIHELLNHYR